MIHFGNHLKTLLLISLSLKDNKEELLSKTLSLFSTWVLNQEEFEGSKDNKPIYYNIVPKPSKM